MCTVNRLSVDSQKGVAERELVTPSFFSGSVLQACVRVTSQGAGCVIWGSPLSSWVK